MRKTHAVKGETDFHTVSDEKLKEMKDTLQQLIFIYSEEKEKVDLLTSMWKDVSEEITQRLVDAPEVPHTEKSYTKLVVKKLGLKRSPFKRI